MANITKSYAKIKNLVFKSITRALNSSVRFPGIWFFTGCITRIAKVYYTKWCPPCPPEKKAMKWEELFGSQKLFKGSWIFFRFNGRGCPNGGVLWIQRIYYIVVWSIMFLKREHGQIVIYVFFSFFYLSFISWTFRTTVERRGHFFNSSLPLPRSSQTLRHWPGDYCRELTSAHK